MPRLDVYLLPESDGGGYIVDVQAKLLDYLDTRVVVPLLPTASAPPAIRDLNPRFEIGGTEHVFVAQYVATVRTKTLRSIVTTLTEYRDEITRAMDILLLVFRRSSICSPPP